MANERLHNAKRVKNDEFYTRMEDVSRELYHYRHHFQGKSVFLNCDDPEESNFWKYFQLNFDDLGLARLISTHYHPTERTYKLVMERDENGNITTSKTPLEGNGDFRSAECVELLDECDIVVTNPPFSLFREYVALLMEHKKKFLVIGNMNAITYKEIFPLLQGNLLWTGYKPYGGGMDMIVPAPLFDPTKVKKYYIDDEGNAIVNIMGCIWFTNLDIDKRHQPLTLWKDYDPSEYPKYDNYDAIEVSKVAEIPVDYHGAIGVPITFMDKYCPEQFQIIGSFNAHSEADSKYGYVESELTETISKGRTIQWNGPVVNKKPLYKRIVIQRIDQPEATE